MSSAQTIIRLLQSQKKFLAIAESCTGGWLSKQVTDIAGASKVMTGSIVAYSNEAKRRVLGVSGKILTSRGAVSKETACAMAEKVRRLFGADYGLSVTGISGPTGGSVSKPVGLTYIGLSTARTTQGHRFLFKGDRAGNRRQAVHKALQILNTELGRADIGRERRSG